jgi:hypothetical protein
MKWIIPNSKIASLRQIINFGSNELTVWVRPSGVCPYVVVATADGIAKLILTLVEHDGTKGIGNVRSHHSTARDRTPDFRPRVGAP